MTMLPAKVLDALARGQQIEAIRLLREASGLGLKETKGLIDAHLADKPMPVPTRHGDAAAIPAEVAEALRQGKMIEAIKLLRAHTGLGLQASKDRLDSLKAHAQGELPDGLSPGEMPHTNGRWGLALILLGALAAYYFFAGSAS